METRNRDSLDRRIIRRWGGRYPNRSTRYKEVIFYRQLGGTLEQISQTAVYALSLGTFKVSLSGALSSLVWWEKLLLTAGGLDWVTLKCPCPNCSIIL